MATLPGLSLLAVTVVVMEAFAWAMHRWLMHGPGWFLHRSHHSPRDGWFEANDGYAIIFAAPSFVLIYLGSHGNWAGLTWVGGGIAAYGAIYFIFHDIIVHRRVRHRYVARSSYMRRIMQAHRLHHAVATRTGAVSFGFLWAPSPRKLKAQLRAGSGEGERHRSR